MGKKIGFIGLGHMGKNMVLHLLEEGVDVVAYNRTRETTQKFIVDSSSFIEKAEGKLTAAFEIKELVKALAVPRVVWLMVPNGSPVDDVLQQLIAFGIEKGDIVIDGGNCYYKDTVRRAKELATKGIQYIDCGTSGGLEGARHGACLMIGGDEATVKSLEWLWDACAVKGDPLQDLVFQGWGYFGPSGAGHFVKMVHNGVEYGMNQAIGEGFEVLSKGPYDLDFAKIANVWSHGSVVRGWLIELLAKAFEKDPKLNGYRGVVGGGQTGGWTVATAKELGVNAEVLDQALKARERSQMHPSFAGKVVSALRFGYGGHKEPAEK